MFYYLTHEYKEKWSLLWRQAIAIFCLIILVLISVVMIDSSSVILVILGMILIIFSLFMTMLALNKIRYNVVVKRFIPNFKVTIGQMFKKQLAYLTFAIITMVIAICILFITLLSMVIGMIMLVVLIIAATVLGATFNFAIINNLANEDYSYRSVFTKFHLYVSKYLSIAVILEAKLAIFGFVLGFINGFIKSFAQSTAIILIVINEQFIPSLSILIVAALISLFLDFILFTYPTQLSIATYFDKVEPKLNKDGFTKMNERSESCAHDTKLDEVSSN